MNVFCIRPKGFNIGNDAIFTAMKHFIKESFGFIPNLIVLPATTKYEGHSKGGLTAKTIYEINQYGNGVIVGGGNLYENNELSVDANALKALSVPLFLFSLSRGRVYNRKKELVDRTDVMPDPVLQALHKRADISLTRDEATQKHLEKIGVTNSQVGACPTLFLNRLNLNYSGITEVEKNLTLISIRTPEVMSVPLSFQARMREDIKKIIEDMKKQGHHVKILCHDHRDIAYASCFENVEYLYLEDIYTYLSVLKNCRLMISYRLHSALPCLSFGRPVVNITYDERAMSLFETAGLSDWSVNMIRSDNVPEEVQKKLKGMGALQDQLIEVVEKKWSFYYQVMAKAHKDFAQKVKQYSEGLA